MMSLHAQPLVEVLRKNSKNIVAGGEGLLVIVGVHASLEEALEYKRYLRGLRKEQDHEEERDTGEVPVVRVQVQGEEAPQPLPDLRNGK